MHRLPLHGVMHVSEIDGCIPPRSMTVTVQFFHPRAKLPVTNDPNRNITLTNIALGSSTSTLVLGTHFVGIK